MATTALLALFLQLAAAPAAQQARATEYDGRANRVRVEIPKLESDVEVDGNLSEPVWENAALLTGFSQYQPVDGLPADDSTKVSVWYDDHNIYFGIRAYEQHGAAQGTLGDRDKTWSDDYVHVLLDTFKDGRRAFIFGANPLGVQTDGAYSEGRQCTGGSNPANNCSVDTSPDFLYQSKGRVTPWGYEIEMRVPFKSLRYQSDDVQDWGIQVVRQVQHSGHQLTWTQARRGENSFLAQSGTLVGMTELKRGLVMDFNPVMTSKLEGSRRDATWRYDASRPEIGGNVRWGLTANLTLNGTFNPDFSQVESDAAQAAFDPRQALFFEEKRPFFLEGSEIFNTNNPLIYTRRIVNPVAATKVTGKVSNTEVGFISAVDGQDYSFDPGAHNPVYNLFRVRRDLGDRSNAGFLYTDKVDGSTYNRVASVDTRLVFANKYAVFFQGAYSFTRRANGTTAGAPLFDLNFVRSGRAFNLFVGAKGWHPDFVAASGFLGRREYATVTVNPSHTVYNLAGGKIESWRRGVQLVFDSDWSLLTEGNAGDVKLHLNSTLAFKGGWRTQQSIFIESFKYPPSLYANYFVEVPRAGGVGTDTVPFKGTNRIPNLDGFITFNTPQWKSFDANGWICWGRDENFYEWAPAYILTSNLTANYRPTDQLRLGLTYVHQQFVRPSDKSTVATQQIPRLKLEYQLSRPIFFRVVGEYSSDRQSDLRDDTRTNGRLLYRDNETGTFVPLTRQQTNGFRADWLFSYQPNPGTVFFVGYGSSLTEPEAFRFSDMRRQADGFFVKVSYLFRM